LVLENMQCRAPFLHCLSNTLPATKDPIRKTNCEIKNKTVTQVLIHWDGLSPADATWEFTDELKLQFPRFNLEDKVGFKERQLLPAEEEEINPSNSN
jgi:hypothetical protein